LRKLSSDWTKDTLTSGEERRQLIFDRTRGHGADVVAEFAGLPEVVEDGVQLLRTGGR